MIGSLFLIIRYIGSPFAPEANGSSSDDKTIGSAVTQPVKLKSTVMGTAFGMVTIQQLNNGPTALNTSPSLEKDTTLSRMALVMVCGCNHLPFRNAMQKIWLLRGDLWEAYGNETYLKIWASVKSNDPIMNVVQNWRVGLGYLHLRLRRLFSTFLIF
ncbi:hypothetical protein [Absidia glauca]|uniref:Uncharacterized protein n=1 Tax=Absidia glauca TaxID=4829 RepID=A0A168RVH0_ABSGL|nr:hypothetical protein [Absidia glauca]